MKKELNLIFLTLILSAVNIFGQVDAKLMRYPDVSETHICFVYANDVWVVNKEGGLAHKLSSPEGKESFPKFSPDGKKIAFTGNYDGNKDIYSIPTFGGSVTRLTHHQSSDRMLDWFPDSKNVLFASSRKSGRQRFRQFYSTSSSQPLPKKLPVPYGEFGSLSENGNKIAYTIKTRAFRNWKGYRGGWAPNIWIFNLKNKEAQRITNSDANESNPMWHNDKIYFRSDQGKHKRYNLYVYNTKTEKTRKLTNFSNYDIKFPSLGPSEIVFQAGNEIYLFHLKNEKVEEVDINVSSDRLTVKPKQIKVNKSVSNFAISPKGQRILLEAHGELFSVPKKHGYYENITQSSASAQKDPTYSPNGKYIAYWDDSNGEYQLVLQNTQNSEQQKVLTDYGSAYRYQPYWSPDGKKLVFINSNQEIKLYNRETGNTIEIDQCQLLDHPELKDFKPSWSDDSKWLAYAKGQSNSNKAIFVYNLEKKESRKITSNYYNDTGPVFGSNGKYLFFLSDRHFSPEYSDMDNSFIYPNSTKLIAASLQKDTPSPLSFRNDSIKITKSKTNGNNENGQEKKSKKSNDESDKIEIDFKNIEHRLTILPPEHGNYSHLGSADGKILYMKFSNTGSANNKKELKYYDIANRETKTIISGINDYKISAKNNKLAVSKGNKIAIINISPGQSFEDALPKKALQMQIDPLAEWHQIFDEAWRVMRDFFYDPNMHGVDWKAMKKKYRKLLDGAATRSDVNYLIGEMISELNSSHTYEGGGNIEKGESKKVGALGVNFTFDNNHYKISQIIRGAPWENDIKSPFDKSGISVSEGDYIYSINGTKLSKRVSPWKVLQGLSKETVKIEYADNPNNDNIRTEIVKTLSTKQEIQLRHMAWVEQKRQYVTNQSDGKLGYIYVKNTSRSGQNELVRQFQAQFKKEALIIDERFNGGGQIPDRFIELLNRKPLSYWATRTGQDWQWPPVAHFGPKAMLINGWSGSGGDAFPYYFRKRKLGKLIGTKTWGGLIGYSGAPRLVDGGRVTVPSFRMYTTDGKWFQEGQGVKPDIKVIDHPEKLAHGERPQLDKAINVLMEKIKNNGYKKPQRPEYEDRSLD